MDRDDGRAGGGFPLRSSVADASRHAALDRKAVARMDAVSTPAGFITWEWSAVSGERGGGDLARSGDDVGSLCRVLMG